MNQNRKSMLRRIPLLGRITKILRRFLCAKAPNRYLKYVSDPGFNNVKLESGGLAVPPIMFRDMVRKGAVLAEEFLLEGRQVFDAIFEVLENEKIEVNRSANVFEFGVGCGRVARHFFDEGYLCFTGSDVDPELIGWCDENITNACDNEFEYRFFVNDYHPRLECRDESFELAYSISVFTHMNVDSQKIWFDELARVLKPGGILLISFLEKSPSDLPGGVEVIERIDREFKRSWLGKGDAPKTYFNTYNSLRYIQEILNESFDFVGHSQGCIRRVQSLAVFRKK